MKSNIVDTDKAWQKLHGRLKADGLLNGQEGEFRPSSIPAWTKWAASFMLLITLGGLLYFMLNPVAKHDTIQLVNNEEQTLVKTLADGSVVYLAAQSQLIIPQEFSPNERRVKIIGEAFFDVAHNPLQPFIVEAGKTQIQVVGTSFNVKSFNDQTLELFVEEGLVNVFTNSAEETLVEPGELLIIRSGSLTKAKSAELSLTLWRQNRMHFKDEELGKIIMVINKNFGSKLLIEDPFTSQRKMTVTFFNNSLPAIVDLISLSMNLEASPQADDSIVFYPK
jgi:ferric-dicitrate binding protein FerR (iron transport regulator)